MSRFILALDQGTTSSRAIVFDRDGAVVSMAQQEFPQIFPGPGHVEHDPEAIWSSQLADRARGARQGRASRPPTSPRSASPTSARRRSCGSARPASPSPTRSSGRAASRAPICDRLKADGPRGDCSGAKTGLVRRCLLLRHQDQAPARHDPRPARPRRARRGPVRHRRHVPDLAADRRHASTSPTSATPAARCSSTSTRSSGTTSCCALLDVPRAMLPEVRVVERGLRRHRCRRCFGARDPDRRRRRRSAGGALRPGVLRARHARRTPTAPAASCCSTPARRRCRRRTAC